MMMNVAVVAGTLSSDPEIRVLPSGERLAALQVTVRPESGATANVGGEPVRLWICAERAYGDISSRGYRHDDVNVVMSDDTRKRPCGTMLAAPTLSIVPPPRFLGFHS